MTLHILNLITPLTPSRSSPAVNGLGHPVGVRKVDITAPGLRSVLQALVDAEAHAVVGNVPVGIAGDNDTESQQDTESQSQQQQVVDLLVKVSPPVYVRVTPPSYLLKSSPSSSSSSPSSSSLGHAAAHRRRTTSEAVDAFMTSWTRLVGDPVLSKWIVVFLAISISLNGYLLKGIAAGLVLPRLRRGTVGVRFEAGEDEDDVVVPSDNKPSVRVAEEVGETERDRVVAKRERQLTFPILPPAPVVVPRPLVVARLPSPAPAPAPVPTFTLADVDRRLNAERRMLASPSTSTSTSDVDDETQARIRTLEECIDVFENGPRPLSLSLSMLNDEEVILLAQNGKIAAYALEKVLGMENLERAVRVRRALICEFFFCLSIGLET